MALKRNCNFFSLRKKLEKKKTNKNSETVENLEWPQKILNQLMEKDLEGTLVEEEK